MRIRAKELNQARKRKKEAYKLRTQAEVSPEAKPTSSKPTRTTKKGES